MASSDDESDFGPKSVSNYHFVDDDDAPTSFSELPLYWGKSEDDDGKKKEQIFVHGSADNGLQKIHKEVVAWKFDLSNTKPEISVLTKEKNWIKLEKPRKSFEEIIRTVLITVQCLHFCVRNPDASGKSLWDHLAKVFSLYEVKPSQNDLVDHTALISEALKHYKGLAKSKFLLAFVDRKPRKRKHSDEDVKSTDMSGFIVDDDNDTLEDGEDDDKEDDLYDSVCAFCDNGGHIICCDGICLRSFHPKVEDGIDSSCESLGFSKREEDAINNFYCKNCQYKQHQCFACGELGSSDKSSGAEVFQCGSATCGHFYHPHCIAKLLHPDDEVAAGELQKNIVAGHSFFTCPMHKCCVCKQGEDKQIKELQFAVCRRCPTSYHRKCLPKEIHIVKKPDDERGEAEEEEEEEEDDDVEDRAWEGLLPGRLLLYCLKHEIDDELGTPFRDIRFPGVKKKQHVPGFRGSSGKVLSDKKKLISKDSFSERTAAKEKWEISEKKDLKLKRSGNMSSGLDSSRNVKESYVSKKLSRGSLADATEVKRFVQDSKTSLGNRLFSLMNSSEGKLGKQDLLTSEQDDTSKRKNYTKKLSSELPSLDADAERSILALMEDVETSITLEDVIKKRKAPSTHSSSLKQVIDKTITAGRVDAAVQAIRTALEKLEAGCSPEDAKAICEPAVLRQIPKWKNKLSVYLAPLLRGKRYTSFGRHFTKVEKLEKIVDLLHWYVKDGDMIVDFCCGSNDFSCLMKKKLEETGKECSYKNFDLIQPKTDFNFEKRDWMSVQPKELPKRGSQLIMGLNPPFGVKAALANKFIDHALQFKPKLLILIVPPETERLDKKTPPYDLIWEDDQCLAGKSFYLPGSIDENDKQMEQWNLTTPPLYLWSRRDWTARYMSIAQNHGHSSTRLEGSNLKNASELTDQLDLQNKEPAHKETVTEDTREFPTQENTVRENRDNRNSDIKQSKETSLKRKHGEYDKKPENIQDSRKSPRQDSSKGEVRSSKKGTPSKSPQTVKNIAPNPKHKKSGGSKNHTSSSKVTEILLHGDAVNKEVHDSENRRSGSDMSLDSNSSKGKPETKSPIINLHAEDVGTRKPNLDRRSSSTSVKSAGSGMPRGSREGSSPVEDRFPSRSSGRGVYGNNGGIRDDVSTNFSTNHYDYRSSAEGAGYMGRGRGYGQNSDYSAHRNYMGGGYEPAYGYMDPLPYRHLDTESYRMSRPPVSSMQPAGESHRTNGSAMSRYAPRLDEMNHTRMNEMGPDPSMLSRGGMYNPPPPPQPGGYNVDSGFAPGPYNRYSHYDSTGWLDE